MSRAAVTVIITGASGGIGEALALNLAKRPAAAPVAGATYQLVLMARREQQLQQVADACNAAAGKPVAKFVVGDATKRADIARTCEFAVSEFGGVDVWINNAGRGITKNALDLTDEEIDDMMDINVKSAQYGMQTAAAHFRGRKSAGQIININSISGRNATFTPSRVAYNAAKHFLAALTDCARIDLKAEEATKDVVVSTVAPGPVKTDFGLNAGSADSRANPMAQEVDACVEAIRQCIETKAEEVYTDPKWQPIIAEFIASKGRA